MGTAGVKPSYSRLIRSARISITSCPNILLPIISLRKNNLTKMHTTGIEPALTYVKEVLNHPPLPFGHVCNHSLKIKNHCIRIEHEEPKKP